MRALPVVKGQPVGNAIADFLEVSLPLGPVVPLLFQTAPERLDFPVALGRARTDVVDVFPLEVLLEQRPPEADPVLRAVVGEDVVGPSVGGDSSPKDLEHELRDA